MKKAVLVLGNGETLELEGEFVILSPGGGRTTMELTIIDWYRDGAKVDDLVCGTFDEAVAALRERADRRRKSGRKS